MALNAKKVKMAPSANYVQQSAIEAGSYPCRVVQVLDLGMQKQRPYQGEPKPPAHEIMVTYEFTDEFCLDKEGKELEDKPRWLSETMPLRNLASDLAKSTKRYRALDPDEVFDGDFTKLTGSPCNVTVVNNPDKQGRTNDDGSPKVWENIQSISTMRSKDVSRLPELANPSKVFLLDEPDLEVLGSLPTWLQDKIKTNLEYQGSVLQKALEGGASEEASAEEPEEVVIESTKADADDSEDWV